eukprot:10413171-Ditylum_brightwellii.AAC.1
MACNVQDASVDIFVLSGIDFFLHIYPGFELGDVLGRDVESARGIISSSFSSWRCLAMLAFKFFIISRSSLRTADAGGSLVGKVKEKGNSELVSHVIISPAVGEFEHCDATGVIRSDLL